MDVLRVVLWIGVGFVFFQIVARIVRRIYRRPAPSFFAFFFDSKLRKILQPHDKVIRRSRIAKGMNVLEVGCGNGAFTTLAARYIGERGRVVATDLQQKMIDLLNKKIERPEYRHLNNIETVRAPAYALPFADESFDLVYLVTVLQEIPDRRRALLEMKRVLKNGGIISVSEFVLDPDYPLPRTTVKDLKEAGFREVTYEGTLLNYTAIGRKETREPS